MLVRGGRAGSRRTVSAAETILPGAWPEDRGVLTDRLREARERHEMPSRARVVAWGEESSIEPLVAAGFEVVSVLSPAQALTRVVRARQASAPAGTAIAAVSLNTHGAAIVIVAGTEVIHSRSFEWPLGAPFTGARTELLDRYLLVSQLAPQLQHAIALVRPVYGVAVTSIVTCGNLPGLRSLSMLLIQEMDFEVETLDSADLLDAGLSTSFGESAATLQLAAAVASSGERRVRVHESATASENSTSDDRISWMRLSIVTGLQHAAAVAVLVLCATWSVLQMTGTAPAVAVFRDGQTNGPVEELVVAVPPLLELRAEATSGRSTVENGTPARPADDASPMRLRQRAAPEPATPLPSVDGVLITGTQRLAIVGGVVVSPGDAIGARAVARIERDGVVLREPSGLETYVAIRTRNPRPPVREKL